MRSQIKLRIDNAQVVAIELNGALDGSTRVNTREGGRKDLARGVMKVERLGHRNSLHVDVGSQLAETPVAETSHHHQMFGAAKRPVALAMLDDARGERRADARKLFEFVARCDVDVYERWCCSRHLPGDSKLRRGSINITVSARLSHA